MRARAPPATDRALERAPPEEGFFTDLEGAEEECLVALRVGRASSTFAFAPLLEVVLLGFAALSDPALAALTEFAGAALFAGPALFAVADFVDPAPLGFADLFVSALFGFADLLAPLLTGLGVLGRAAFAFFLGGAADAAARDRALRCAAIRLK